MCGCCAPVFGKSRATRDCPIRSPIQTRQLRRQTPRRFPTETSHACGGIRPAPSPDPPEKASREDSRPPLGSPAAALRRARLSFTVRWARLGCIVLTNTTSPQCLRNPIVVRSRAAVRGHRSWKSPCAAASPLKCGERTSATQQQQHDRAHETRASGFSKLSRSTQ